MTKYCKHCFAHTEFSGCMTTDDMDKESFIGERQVSFHCDIDGMSEQALASGEDDIVFKMWLGDNFIDIDKCNPQDCKDYEEETDNV